MKFEPATMEPRAIPKGESSSEILTKYRAEGQQLEARYHEVITTIRDECFRYLGVTSAQQLQEKLQIPVDGKYASLPMGFTYPIHLAGRKGKIQSDQNGKNRLIFIEKGHEDKRPAYEIEMEAEYGAIDQEPSDQRFNDICEQLGNNNIAAMVWQSNGLYSDIYDRVIIDSQHNGVYNKSRIAGIGYALYRMHEEIFGMMREEITPRLSLLKLYLRLGFTPDTVIKPADTSISSLSAEDMVKDYLSNGEEILPFPITLKRP